MAKRPHIIIFNPDEMRGDALAHLGNPASITPNLTLLLPTRRYPLGRHIARIPSACPAGAAFLPACIPMCAATAP